MKRDYNKIVKLIKNMNTAKKIIKDQKEITK